MKNRLKRQRCRSPKYRYRSPFLVKRLKLAAGILIGLSFACMLAIFFITAGG